MNRDAAIEAGARALWAATRHYPEIDWKEANAQGHPGVKFCRRQSAAVIDAALPHLARPERVVKAEALREYALEMRAWGVQGITDFLLDLRADRIERGEP